MSTTTQTPNDVVESIEANAALIVNGVNATGIADIESGLTRIQAQAAS